MQDCERIMLVLETFETDEILFADSEAQKNSLWSLRRKVGEAVKSQSIYKEEDTVVPRFELPKLLFHIKEIGRKYGFHSVCYGHAGDGNLHVNIIKGNLSDEVLREVWRIKDELSASYNHDLERLFRDAQNRQRLSGRASVNTQKAKGVR